MPLLPQDGTVIEIALDEAFSPVMAVREGEQVEVVLAGEPFRPRGGRGSLAPGIMGPGLRVHELEIRAPRLAELYPRAGVEQVRPAIAARAVTVALPVARHAATAAGRIRAAPHPRAVRGVGVGSHRRDACGVGGRGGGGARAGVRRDTIYNGKRNL